MSTTVTFRNDQTGHEIKVTIKGSVQDGSDVDMSINFGGKNPEDIQDEDNFKLMAILLSDLVEISEQ